MINDDATGFSVQTGVRVVRKVDAVRISGATGTYGVRVNGVYHPVAGEACGGRPVYKKEGVNMWIEYWTGTRRWQVKSEVDKGKDVALMFSHAGTEAGAVEEVTGGWQVVNDDGTSFSVQAGVRVVRRVDAVPSSPTMDDGGHTTLRAPLRPFEAGPVPSGCDAPGPGVQAGVRVMRKADAVRISGATGKHGARVNGVYHPVAGETCGGRPVYKKEGGDGWIEYSSEWQEWQVKLEASKGKNVASMFSHAVTEAWAVEEVTGGWQVVNDDTTGHSVQAGVRVMKKETDSNMRWKEEGRRGERCYGYMPMDDEGALGGAAPAAAGATASEAAEAPAGTKKRIAERKRKKHQKQKTLVLRREEAKQAEIQELQQRDAALHLEETKGYKRQKEQRRKQNQKRQKCEQKPETAHTYTDDARTAGAGNGGITHLAACPPPASTSIVESLKSMHQRMLSLAESLQAVDSQSRRTSSLGLVGPKMSVLALDAQRMLCLMQQNLESASLLQFQVGAQVQAAGRVRERQDYGVRTAATVSDTAIMSAMSSMSQQMRCIGLQLHTCSQQAQQFQVRTGLGSHPTCMNALATQQMLTFLTLYMPMSVTVTVGAAAKILDAIRVLEGNEGHHAAPVPTLRAESAATNTVTSKLPSKEKSAARLANNEKQRLRTTARQAAAVRTKQRKAEKMRLQGMAQANPADKRGKGAARAARTQRREKGRSDKAHAGGADGPAQPAGPTTPRLCSFYLLPADMARVRTAVLPSVAMNIDVLASCSKGDTCTRLHTPEASAKCCERLISKYRRKDSRVSAEERLLARFSGEQRGKLMHFDFNKGFGFITPDNCRPGADKRRQRIFFHRRDWRCSSEFPDTPTGLPIQVRFHRQQSKRPQGGRWRAVKVSRLGGTKVHEPMLALSGRSGGGLGSGGRLSAAQSLRTSSFLTTVHVGGSSGRGSAVDRAPTRACAEGRQRRIVTKDVGGRGSVPGAGSGARRSPPHCHDALRGGTKVTTSAMRDPTDKERAATRAKKFAQPAT